MDENQELAQTAPLEQTEPVDTRKPWHAPVLGVVDIVNSTDKPFLPFETTSTNGFGTLVGIFGPS